MLNYTAHVDLVFRALADPVRRGMVDRLSRSAATVTELAEPLDMSMPAVMQHLRLLEASGLVTSTKAGRVRTCRLQPAALRGVEDWIASRRAAWEQDLDRLEALLSEQHEDSTAP